MKEEILYEKIVTWKKKPRYWQIPLGIICFLMGLSYCILLATIPYEERLENKCEADLTFWADIFFHIQILFSAILVAVLMAAGIVLICLCVGEGKNVTYKKYEVKRR